MEVDQDQQWLLCCLSATLDPNQGVRSYAEASLNQASLRPGFGAALCRVAANRELPFGLRQLAAVLLKQFIKNHWREDEEGFEHPIVSNEEKAIIRGLLLSSIDDPQRKICTAIGMAVASVAIYDWPDDWPELLPYIMKLINDQNYTNGVNGALRCLSLLSGDLDDKIVPKILPTLFPCLHSIVSSRQIYEKYLRAKALSIVYSCIAVLGAMKGVYETQTTALMKPLLKPLIDQSSQILGHPVQPEDPDDWSIRMEVLKCLNQLVQSFPSLAEDEFMIVVGPLWQTYVSSLEVYIRGSIEGTEDSYDGRYDSDGEEKSLDSFIIQLFEFLLTIIGCAKLSKVIANNVRELAYYTIGFLQITEQQVHTWSTDINQYIADEDEVGYSCRSSGALLLEELVNLSGNKGVDAIMHAVKARFHESKQEKATGFAVWWRMREAALFALASSSDQLLETEDSGSTQAGIANLLEEVIAEDIGIHQYPFLHARIFMAVAKFFSVISSRSREHFLHAAIRAISIDVPAPVKVGACRALIQLLPEADKGIAQPQIMSLLSSLTGILHQASDETLILVLETLQAAIKAGHEVSASMEPVITPAILNVWEMHVSDPFISIDVVEVLEAIKNAPGCIHPLASRALAYVGPVLNKPQQRPDGLVAGSLDLLTMLLKNAPVHVVKAVYDVCFNAVIQIILQSDDHSELQNATECLASFIAGGREDLLFWGGDSAYTMRSLLDVASRLLDPDLESSGSLFVGKYILQLILHLPSQMAQHLRNLVVALVGRMQSAQIVGLRSSLLVIFARLVHLSAPSVEQFINLLVSIPADGHENSLVYIMSEWTKLQGEVQGAYQIRVTTSALALLLTFRHPELAKIKVQGYPIKSIAGITTRSKAKSAPHEWTMLQLPEKILALLADTLIEIQEQVLGGYDGDSDWEEIQDLDVDSEKDLLYTSSATVGRSKNDQLEAMARFYNENQDDGDDYNAFDVVDPLNEMNLVKFLADFFTKFVNNDRQLFNNLSQNLTQAQRNAIEMLLSQ